jgi:hypothetical protein
MVLPDSGDLAEVDGGFGDVSRENIQGNGDSPRRDLRELIRLLVVLAGNVVELDAVEFVLKCADNVAIGLHLLIVAARILHDLVDYELSMP